MDRSVKVAVMGASGVVGRKILALLGERNFPMTQVHALTSTRSQGRSLSVGEETVVVTRDAKDFDFADVDLVFGATSEALAQNWVPRALEKGCVVIDKSSAFRMHPEVNLVIPELTDFVKIPAKRRLAERIAGAPEETSSQKDRYHNILASPNCVVIPVALTLARLARLAPLMQASVSTYQAISGAGQAPMDEIYRHMRALLIGQEAKSLYFPFSMGFNVIPWIGDVGPQGHCEEEQKIHQEVIKLLTQIGMIDDEGALKDKKTSAEGPSLFTSPDFDLAVSCVRVSALIGHGVTLHVTFDRPFQLQDVQDLFERDSSFTLIEDVEAAHAASLTPVGACGQDEIFLGRLRKTGARSLALWMICDNLRKGAALNAVQIAEALIAS